MILSVSMVVKNEEGNLDRIIKDCMSFACEIVVCDTGSTDNTIQIAKDLGAKVVEFPWCDDFAAARNASLKACSGKYILWVDADDRILKSDQEKILDLKMEYLPRPKLREYALELLSANDKKENLLTYQPRIFPKIGENLWKGRVHESVSLSMRDNKIPTIRAFIKVLHEGYSDGAMYDSKLERNMRLLEKEHEDGTANFVKTSYLGATHYAKSDPDKALSYMAKIINDKEMLSHPPQHFIYLLRLYLILFEKGETKAAWGAMELAKKLFDDPQPWIGQAKLAFMKGEMEFIFGQKEDAKERFKLSLELTEKAKSIKFNEEAGLPVFTPKELGILIEYITREAKKNISIIDRGGDYDEKYKTTFGTGIKRLNPVGG